MGLEHLLVLVLVLESRALSGKMEAIGLRPRRAKGEPPA